MINYTDSTWKNPALNTSDSKPILPYTSDTMKSDLTQGVDRPIWPLTCYGPAKYEPTLLSGLDESPEELRFKAFTATKAGNMQEYVRYIHSSFS
ncbi:hypothetical protein BD779DRAFT_658960 [Infundibulicybe gibba]|nr:hypothetical protein BD779DRAFT_658960 [Infundibulicybe gibba]